MILSALLDRLQPATMQKGGRLKPALPDWLIAGGYHFEDDRLILMLEDDRERIERFTAALKAVAPTTPLVIWRSAKMMVREVEPFLSAARLISLDHDLEPWEGDVEDPVDGIEVAKFLAERPPVCPVIVHTSNGTRGDWMIGEFELGGWKYKRVAPIGQDWIEAYWRVVVRKLLDP